jgi:four helix bundle protein
MHKKENPVVEKSIDFAIMVIKFCELLEEKRKYVIANQLLKAGTSIGLFYVKEPSLIPLKNL